MARSFFLSIFFLSPLFSIAQSTSQMEASLLGTWHLSATTELSIPDSLYSKIRSEEVFYMVFDEGNEAFIKFSSSLENRYYEGKYEVYCDKKNHTTRIKLKGSFGNCEERYIEIVSITDTTLTIRSCINSIDLIFVKSPLPKAQVEQIKKALQGTWDQVRTDYSCTIEDSIKRVSNRYDYVKTLQFFQDSVYIQFRNNQQPISSKYRIHHNLYFDLLIIDILALSHHGCDPRNAQSFNKLTQNTMILSLCDCDFSQVIFEKQSPVKKE